MSSSAHLGFLIGDISRLMRRRFMEQANHSNLTLAQSRALVYLSRHQGLRQVELAELLEIQPITLTRQLDQLVEAGLVERRKDEQDRRAFRLYLTGAATPCLTRINELADEVQQRALAGLSPEDADTLTRLLLQVRTNLS